MPSLSEAKSYAVSHAFNGQDADAGLHGDLAANLCVCYCGDENARDSGAHPGGGPALTWRYG